MLLSIPVLPVPFLAIQVPVAHVCSAVSAHHRRRNALWRFWVLSVVVVIL